MIVDEGSMVWRHASRHSRPWAFPVLGLALLGLALLGLALLGLALIGLAS